MSRTLRIRDLERLTGIPRSTIHYYLRQGLLPPPRRRGRTVADYGEEHVRALQVVRELQERERLTLREIADFLRDGRPTLRMESLEHSLDVLGRFARAHTEDPEQAAERIDRALDHAVAGTSSLESDASGRVEARVREWLNAERDQIEASVGREIDLVFRAALDSGELESIGAFYDRVVSLAESGRRVLGRAIRDRMVLALLEGLRSGLKTARQGLDVLEDGAAFERSAVDVALASVRERADAEGSRSDAAWTLLRGLAWHGRREEATALAPAAVEETSRAAERALLLGEHRDLPEAGDHWLHRIARARADVDEGLDALVAGAADARQLRATIEGLEILERLAEDPALDAADPWHVLLAVTHAARVLAFLPRPLTFVAAAGRLARRATEILDGLPGDHPILSLGVHDVVQANLRRCRAEALQGNEAGPIVPPP